MWATTPHALLNVLLQPLHRSPSQYSLTSRSCGLVGGCGSGISAVAVAVLSSSSAFALHAVVRRCLLVMSGAENVFLQIVHELFEWSTAIRSSLSITSSSGTASVTVTDRPCAYRRCSCRAFLVLAGCPHPPIGHSCVPCPVQCMYSRLFRCTICGAVGAVVAGAVSCVGVWLAGCPASSSSSRTSALPLVLSGVTRISIHFVLSAFTFSPSLMSSSVSAFTFFCACSLVGANTTRSSAYPSTVTCSRLPSLRMRSRPSMLGIAARSARSRQRLNSIGDSKQQPCLTPRVALNGGAIVFTIFTLVSPLYRSWSSAIVASPTPALRSVSHSTTCLRESYAFSLSMNTATAGHFAD
eukprot:PhF_6_TR31884/c1_g1_i7/m.47410